METVWIVAAALALDAAFGEPRRYHPLVGFGMLALRVEQRLYRDTAAAGALALCLVLAPLVVAALVLQWLASAWLMPLQLLVLYLAIGWRSLGEHAARVRDALLTGDQAAACEAAGRMVSRDTADLEEEGLTAATVESVLENGNDAVFGAIFWFVVAGLPGVLLYRLANTLDAMWGYRNTRYLHFGRAAARLDDLLNYLPARLTALSYALVGSTGNALHCWREQAGRWKSINAGPVMAAGAGSLRLALGGAAVYGGRNEYRPALGRGNRPGRDDIDRACKLVLRAVGLWIVTLLAGGWLVAG